MSDKANNKLNEFLKFIKFTINTLFWTYLEVNPKLGLFVYVEWVDQLDLAFSVIMF